MSWVNRHKVVRRLSLLFICVLIGFATWRVFGPAKVSAPEEYVALTLLFGVATGFYMKWRKDEDHDTPP